MQLNQSGHYRGLHIVVIDPIDGTVKLAKVFDTFESSEDLSSYLFGPSSPTAGSIVVATCKNECWRRFSDSCKRWFKKMGSTEIDNVEHKQAYVFIGTVG